MVMTGPFAKDTREAGASFVERVGVEVPDADRVAARSTGGEREHLS